MKKKEYFIGLDSDGTVFDSMTIKHKKAFIPTLVKIWDLKKNEELVFKIGEDINLYSKTRGIDRFRGLLLLFQRLQKAGVSVPDFSDLELYVNSGIKLSNSSLRNYLETNKSSFLKEVFFWSEKSDEIFLRETCKIKPFENVRNALTIAKDRADIAVISSASHKSLMIDWKRNNLCTYVQDIYGQESGTKKEQLLYSVGEHYKNRRLIIGDTLIDYYAAKSVKAFFYPIIPQKEEECWSDLSRIYMNLFFSDEFNIAIQRKIMLDFLKSLNISEGEMENLL